MPSKTPVFAFVGPTSSTEAVITGSQKYQYQAEEPKITNFNSNFNTIPDKKLSPLAWLNTPKNEDCESNGKFARKVYIKDLP